MSNLNQVEPSRRPRSDSGKGAIGFIVALAVVLFAGNALFRSFQLKNRADEMKDQARLLLGAAEQQKWEPDTLKLEILKKAKELRIPIDRADRIKIERDDSRWRLRFEWDEVLAFPGYSKSFHYEVDETWTRF